MNTTRSCNLESFTSKPQVLGVEMFRATAGAEADEHMASLMGHFGQTTNSLSLLMSLFGTSLCVRLLGLRKTLRIFPTLLVVAVVTSFFAPSLSFLFVAVAILKVRPRRRRWVQRPVSLAGGAGCE